MTVAYLSCPITDNPHHRQQLNDAEIALSRVGWGILNPLDIEVCADRKCGGVWKFSPPEQGVGFEYERRGDDFYVNGQRLTAPDLWKFATYEHSWSCYMRHDLLGMLRCQAIVLLPGWERSPGCRLECHVAASAGMEVHFYDPELGDLKP